MRCIFRLTGIALLGLLLTCEDAIEVPSRFEEPQPVVEAWLTDQSRAQTIRLSLTQDFFANETPTYLDDATVTVCQTAIGQECFVFEPRDSGRYVWTPEPGQTLGEVGERFALGIQRGEETYGAVTELYRVPPIDSISFQFEEEALGLEEGFYSQLYARDLPGVGDTYLIRSSFNDTLLLRPTELRTVYDAVFDAGTGADGITFIFPLRFSINKIDEDGAPVPLVDGDEVSVELWSISPQAFFFLGVVEEQIQNGDAGIFGVPVANSPGNIVNVDTREPVLGMFNVAAVSSARRIFGD